MNKITLELPEYILIWSLKSRLDNPAGYRFYFYFETSKVTPWLKSNKFALNIAKPSYMLWQRSMLFFKPNNDVINLSLANETINKVTSTKFLGMIIDDKLTQLQLDDSAFLRTQNYITEICYFEFLWSFLNFG